MGRPRKFANGAVRQRDYRFRQRLKGLPPQAQLHARAAMVHRVIARCAVDGHELAIELAGQDYQETALKVLVRFEGDLAAVAEYLKPFYLEHAQSRGVELK